MQKRSFLTGAGRGFSAPGMLLRPLEVHRDERFNASVDKAWEDVAKVLNHAMTVEGQHIGKKTGASEIRHRRRGKVLA